MLRRCGHVRGSSCEYAGRSILRLELAGKRPLKDPVKEAMESVGVRDQDGALRVGWRQILLP